MNSACFSLGRFNVICLEKEVELEYSNRAPIHKQFKSDGLILQKGSQILSFPVFKQHSSFYHQLGTSVGNIAVAFIHT